MAHDDFATGPGRGLEKKLPRGERIGAISAVDVYPLIMEILGLEPAGAIDGDPARLLPLLGKED